jgi:hypothetical protein
MVSATTLMSCATALPTSALAVLIAKLLPRATAWAPEQSRKGPASLYLIEDAWGDLSQVHCSPLYRQREFCPWPLGSMAG